jgi:hypothetical protein
MVVLLKPTTIKTVLDRSNMGNNIKKSDEARTTVGVKQSTKDKLDHNRAPGQCYDGFICQMIDLWEQSNATPKKVR